MTIQQLASSLEALELYGHKPESFSDIIKATSIFGTKSMLMDCVETYPKPAYVAKIQSMTKQNKSKSFKPEDILKED